MPTNELIGREYRSFDGQRRWELLYEHIIIVILDTGMEHGNDCNLIGINAEKLRVVWAVGGVVDSPDQYDGIVNVWIEDGHLWAGTWSGIACQLDHETGEVIKQDWRK